MRTALWQAVKQYQPHLSDQDIDDLLRRVAHQERELVLKQGLSLDQARELVREELFPPLQEPEGPPTLL